MHRLASLLLPALAPVLLSACGGGGSGGGGLAPIETLVVLADDNRTGTLQQLATGAISGPTDFAQVGQIALITGTGDPGDREFRGILTFARPNIPAGATIVSARLTVQNILAGGGFLAGSTTNIGDVVIDHFDVGATLEPTDFDSASLAAAFTVLLHPGGLAGATGDILTVDVTAQFQADVSSGRDQTGLRLLCPAAIVGGAGPHQFFVDGSSPAQFPTLTIDFRR